MEVTVAMKELGNEYPHTQKIISVSDEKVNKLKFKAEEREKELSSFENSQTGSKIPEVNQTVKSPDACDFSQPVKSRRRGICLLGLSPHFLLTEHRYVDTDDEKDTVHHARAQLMPYLHDLTCDESVLSLE